MRILNDRAEIAASSGTELGVSSWIEIHQDRIDMFADATGDHQWIHVDPERAAGGPFGTTIAHGYLTLAMLPQLMSQISRLEGVKLAINYGLNKVRFPAPVPVGSRIRAETTLVEVTDVGGGAHQATYSTTVSIDGHAKPACVAESVVRYLF